MVARVMLDGRPFESLVEYEIRDEQSVLFDSGVMSRYPDILDNAGLPPTWQLITTLPSGNYEIALSAQGEEFVCDGAGTVAVPPRRLGVFLDCRTDPIGPPAGVELGPTVLYIVGSVEAE